MRTDKIEGTTLRCELAVGDGTETCLACGAEIPPRRRRFCSDDCGRAHGDLHRYPIARQTALERDGFRCVRCDAPAEHTHHELPLPDRSYYSRVGCFHHPDGLLSLCRKHHDEEHRFSRMVDRYLTWADGVVSEQLPLPLDEPVAA